MDNKKQCNIGLNYFVVEIDTIFSTITFVAFVCFVDKSQ